jgi:hypothetical protein
MTKPTYAALLAELLGVSQALRSTQLYTGKLTDADKVKRWTVTQNAESMCRASGHAHYRRRVAG